MSTAPFHYRALGSDGGARLGEVVTPRGIIRTPAFMPVGTVATVKALYPDQVKQAGADILLANTYHLMLRPGAERVHRLGGLHSFMRWSGKDKHLDADKTQVASKNVVVLYMVYKASNADAAPLITE